VGYHIRVITKGTLGDVSKIREELEELEDALEQGANIMASNEMSDLYGAIEALAEKMGSSMKDIKKMSKITKRAFRSGRRC
jgi:uncharacterized NAD-dependent epimerase/dehydratase family protein